MMKSYKILFLVSGALLFAGSAVAASGNIGSVAANVTGTFGNLAKLITAGSYIGGLGAGLGAIAKFKAHKDNPQQIPIGTPIMLLVIAAALIFFPSIASMSGFTLFKNGGQTASVKGITKF